MVFILAPDRIVVPDGQASSTGLNWTPGWLVCLLQDFLAGAITPDIPQPDGLVFTLLAGETTIGAETATNFTGMVVPWRLPARSICTFQSRTDSLSYRSCWESDHLGWRQQPVCRGRVLGQEPSRTSRHARFDRCCHSQDVSIWVAAQTQPTYVIWGRAGAILHPITALKGRHGCPLANDVRGAETD